jgi:hypothetical protein
LYSVRVPYLSPPREPNLTYSARQAFLKSDIVSYFAAADW